MYTNIGRKFLVFNLTLLLGDAQKSNAAKKNATFRGHYRTPSQTMHYWPPTQTPSKIPKPYRVKHGGKNKQTSLEAQWLYKENPSRITIHLHPKWVPFNDPWHFYTLTWHFQSAVLRWRYSICTAWFSMFAQIKNCRITVENHDLEYRTHLYNILPT